MNRWKYTLWRYMKRKVATKYIQAMNRIPLARPQSLPRQPEMSIVIMIIPMPNIIMRIVFRTKITFTQPDTLKARFVTS